ncbi:MAG: AAA family ATPase [Thiogranum sp.]|nr:AAA family ATPase [Thiogranum sp.]
MYDLYYGLKERPFSLLPDPDFLFLGEKHRAAIDLLELAVLNQSGFCLLSGEIGAGKTTLIRELLNRLPDSVQVGLVSNTHPSFGELMQWVMAAYGLECGTSSRLDLHKRFIDFVIESYGQGKRTLLIIDEAQNLSAAALEELRMLSNVNSDKDLVLQVMLVGQQQLRDRLRQPELEQFVQRIGVDFHLRTLGQTESRDYIRHRIQRAGGTPDLFSDAACTAVYESSMGVPRLINRICDVALVYAFSETSAVVDAEMVQMVVSDQRIGDVVEAAHTAAEVVNASRTAPRRPEKSIRDAVSPDPSVSDTRAVDSAASSPASADRPADATPEADRNLDPQEGQTLASVQGSESYPQLHRLVIDAERKRKSRPGGRRWGRVLPLLVAAGLGWVLAIGWHNRDSEAVADMRDWYDAAHLRLMSVITASDEPISPVFSSPPEVLPARPAPEAPSAAEMTEPVEPKKTTPVTSVVEEPAHVPVPTKPVAPSAGVVPEDQRAVTTEVVSKQPEVVPKADTAVRDDAPQRESERLARIREEAARMERERRVAERRLAEQLKTRLALEQKARIENERMLKARDEAERLAAERARAARDTVPSPVPSIATEPTRFQANPCEGPSARFMSTCTSKKP